MNGESSRLCWWRVGTGSRFIAAKVKYVVDTTNTSDSTEPLPTSEAGAPEEIDAAIARGVEALRQFDPMDWVEGWIGPEEIARVLYRAMLPPPQETELAATSSRPYRNRLPASVLRKMIRT